MNKKLNRRDLLKSAAVAAILPTSAFAEERIMHRRPIPGTDELLPVIGLGTYRAFDISTNAAEIATRREIVDLMIGEGGSVIDTSPMYNRAERAIGDVFAAGSPREAAFIATKVWIDGRDAGIQQMNRSAELMRTDVIDLMQVHNLRDTDVHMRTIRDWHEQGRTRYNGLTHYTAGALGALEREMKQYKPDFIQINYSLGEREADRRLLPMAADMGVAVIANRPYQSGALFGAVSGRQLPGWAEDFAESWGQFFLKFIVSHPAVTCAIPATSKPHHMQDNLEAGFGPLPDAATRARMVEYIESL